MKHRNIFLVGFLGYKGAGKSEATCALQESFGFDTLSFADPLRAICTIAFGLDAIHYNDRRVKEAVLMDWPQKSPRELMQLVGTDMFRSHFPDVWVEIMRRRLRKGRENTKGGTQAIPAPSPDMRDYDQLFLPDMPLEEIERPLLRQDHKNWLVAIPDVRFPNEAAMVRDMGGVLIAIENPRNSESHGDEHTSEHSWKGISPDVTIVNSNTLAEFRADVCRVVYDRYIVKMFSYSEHTSGNTIPTTNTPTPYAETKKVPPEKRTTEAHTEL